MNLIELLEKYEGRGFGTIVVNYATWFGPKEGGSWGRSRHTWRRGIGWEYEEVKRPVFGALREGPPFYGKVEAYWPQLPKRLLEVSVTGRIRPSHQEGEKICKRN